MSQSKSLVLEPAAITHMKSVPIYIGQFVLLYNTRRVATAFLRASSVV
jgi:hypothetical protein